MALFVLLTLLSTTGVFILLTSFVLFILAFFVNNNELSLNTNDTLGILGMISKAFIELLITSKLLLAGYNNHDIATLCNISKGRAYYLIKDAKNFKIEELNRYIENLAELDYKIKTGQIPKNVGFELLLLKINNE